MAISIDGVEAIYSEPVRRVRVLSFASKEAPLITQKSDIQGEGNYDAARRFQKEETEFAKSGQVERKAIEAEEALDGPEGEELERARKETGERGA